MWSCIPSTRFALFSSQLCVGFLFLILYPASSPPRSSATATSPFFKSKNFVTTLSHTIFHTRTHHRHAQLVTHFLPYITLWRISFHTHHLPWYTQLCHTHTHSLSLSHPVFFTHHFVITIFHRQLCHASSFVHNFVAHHVSHPHNFVTHHLYPSFTYCFYLLEEFYLWSYPAL